MTYLFKDRGSRNIMVIQSPLIWHLIHYLHDISLCFLVILALWLEFHQQDIFRLHVAFINQ